MKPIRPRSVVMMLIDFILVIAIYPETKGVTLEQLEHKLGIANN